MPKSLYADTVISYVLSINIGHKENGFWLTFVNKICTFAPWRQLKLCMFHQIWTELSFFFGSHIMLYFLSALRIVSRLLGALINQCIWRQSCPHLGQVLHVNKIQTYLMKVGYIAWRKARLELQNFPILIGRGISQGLCLPSYSTYLTLPLFILVRHLSDGSDATFKLVKFLLVTTLLSNFHVLLFSSFSSSLLDFFFFGGGGRVLLAGGIWLKNLDGSKWS